MFLGNIENRVNVEPMIAEIGLLDFKSSFSLLVELNFTNDVKISAWVSEEELKVVDLAIVYI